MIDNMFDILFSKDTDKSVCTLKFLFLIIVKILCVWHIFRNHVFQRRFRFAKEIDTKIS